MYRVRLISCEIFCTFIPKIRTVLIKKIIKTKKLVGEIKCRTIYVVLPVFLKKLIVGFISLAWETCSMPLLIIRTESLV